MTEMVENNSHFTVWKVAEELNMNAETVRLTFIRDINMNKVSANDAEKSAESKILEKRNLIRPLSKTLKNQTFWIKS
jgi:hypothetical protein